MKKWLLKLLIPIVVILMTLSLSFGAFAADAMNTSGAGVLNIPGRPQRGSITVNYVDSEDKGIGNIDVVIFHVANVKDGNSGELEYEISEEFVNCNVDGLSEDKVAEAYATYALEKKLQGIKMTTSEDGKAVFQDLGLGLYLVVQQSEKYTAMPSIISVPMVDGNDLLYDIDIYPKTLIPPAIEVTPMPDEPKAPVLENPPNQPRLPQTGLLQWPIPVLAIGGIALFLAGWLMIMLGKNEKRENR